MKRKITFFFLLIISFILPTKAQDFAVSLKASTLGVNAEVLRSFGPELNARLGAAFFSYSLKGGEGDEEYRYDANAKLLSISLLGDYFPFGGTFRITGGVFINLNKADLDMVPAKSHTIGGDVYTPNKLGTLQANVSFNKAAPYIGIGFGNPTAGNSGLGFTLDIGTIYQGPAKVDLTAKGLLEPSAAPDQEQKLEDNLSWFKWYPVLSFGLIYKF